MGSETRPSRRYRVEVRPAAQRDLKKIPKTEIADVLAAIEALAIDPRPKGCEKLSGAKDLYRVRVGDYRIVYTIEDKIALVLVVALGDRKMVYDLMKGKRGKRRSA